MLLFALHSSRPVVFFPFDENLGKKQLEKLLGATGRIVRAPAHCLSDGECGMTISVSFSKTGCQAKAPSFFLAKRLPNNTNIWVDHGQFLGTLGQEFHVGRGGEDGFP